MNEHKWTAGAIVVAGLLLSFTVAMLGRYQATAASAPAGFGVFILDRWDGTVVLCFC